MTDILFYLFSALLLLFGILVVANPWSRNPVTSAMSLVMAILSMAGLFILLEAYFLAAIQVLVYAGAVIVLFLFVIMLLDMREEERRRFRLLGLVGGALGFLLLAPVLVRTLLVSRPGEGRDPEFRGTAHELGTRLFEDWVLPFEIMGILLLAAMVGVIILSRKESG